MNKINNAILIAIASFPIMIADGETTETGRVSEPLGIEYFGEEYARMEEYVCGKLAACIESGDPDTHIYIKTAGYIRSKKALDILCDNLGVPLIPPPKNIGKYPQRWGTLHLPLSIRSGLYPEGLPAIGAIEQIGLPLEKLLHMVDLHPVSVGIAPIIADLSFSCGGEYFANEVMKCFPSNHWYRSHFWRRISLNPDLSKPPQKCYKFEEKNILFDTNFDEKIRSRYDEMQTNLLERFEAEMTFSSPSITNTISMMGRIRSIAAIPILEKNITICPQESDEMTGGFLFPAVRALIEIEPMVGYCFAKIDKVAPLSLEEALWLRITHEIYPGSLEYDLMRRAETNDTRAVRLLDALPWRRLDSD